MWSLSRTSRSECLRILLRNRFNSNVSGRLGALNALLTTTSQHFNAEQDSKVPAKDELDSNAINKPVSTEKESTFQKTILKGDDFFRFIRIKTLN